MNFTKTLLVLALALGSTVARAQHLPSQEYFSGPNSKDHRSIIMRNARIAGWVMRDSIHYNANTQTWGHQQWEDIHFHLQIDPDFIIREYGDPNHPLRHARLPGNYALSIFDQHRRVPLEDYVPFPPYFSRGININSFILPGSIDGAGGDGASHLAEIDMELNGWWARDRGHPPPPPVGMDSRSVLHQYLVAFQSIRVGPTADWGLPLQS